ncbi:MAG: RNA polymerase sigma factor RpoD/SigA [Spirochaetaceae bacterium]|jgi:RNA polymerase primary sigma factor|nr:RNA polymerase sigma factor RpoD/SigA [Spirochaetaceae bacterium]
MNKTRRIESESQSDENVLAMYINEIVKIPLLNREEEDTAARAAAKGDKDALNKLVKANLRFVVNVAKRYQGQGLPLSDLISEGNIGLMNAVERYDVEKGYHFISYAVWWIRQAILKAICEKSRMIRLPMNRAGELVRIERARKEIRVASNSENEIREVAAMLNMDETLVSDLINISREMVSLDTPVFDDSDAPLGEHIQDEVFQSPYDFAVQSIMHDDIESVLRTLDKKEAEVIRCRYGIGLGAGMTLREVGDRFNLTKERIRQIEMKALKRLQHPKRLKLLQSYVA